MIKLKEAIELYHKERGAISNSYSWYKKYANEDKFITIYDVKIPTKKVKGVWYIKKKKFNDAIKSLSLSVLETKQNTIDYKQNIIHGISKKIITEWGYYINYGNFRFVFNSLKLFRNKSTGEYWYCNKCNKITEQELKKNNNRIFCIKCNTILNK